MTDFVKQIQEIVEGMGRAGALTPAAITQFEAIRVRAEELAATVQKAKDDFERLDKTMRVQAAELTARNAALAQADKRIAEFEKLQKDAERAIWTANAEVERRAEMRAILSDVFRNAEIHRTITALTPIVIPGVNGMMGYVQTGETRTETTETQK
jgi:hypothetical protein